MGHGHDHHHHHHGASDNLKVAFFLNLGFTLLEIVGGILTNSVAILSDAVHDLGDSLSLGFAWWMQNVAGRDEDEKFSFGYKRFSLLGGLITSLVLIGGSTVILFEAIPRLMEPQTPHASGMLVLALFGILVNGAAVLRLRSGHSLNERVVSLHLLEDVLGWFAVLVVSIILLFADLPILDPVLSVVITSWVLFNVLKNLKQIGIIFLQGVPEGTSIKGVSDSLVELPEINSVHHAHLWSLDGEHNVLSAHVVVGEELERCDIIALKGKIREVLSEHHFDHTTIEIEWGSNNCSLPEGE